ncbi:glycoside hydrolase N-terminal domain-containing protein [Streptomyces sp. NPDC049954]|uniref:glycosyl hydrolase family 95 catalytic domain-containing protein n=1 Tax=Streptomyces sp. NPDC049954 TaxID=3155779 RepID=UPI00344A62FB
MAQLSRRDLLLAGAGVAAGSAALSLTGGGVAHAASPAGGPSRDESPSREPLVAWYDKPAREWLEALPVGNGRLGAMVFGGTDVERLQLNENSVWAGQPHDYDNPEALAALPEIRRLVFADEWSRAQELIDQHVIGRPAAQLPYQPVGDLTLTFAGPGEVRDYRRELDLDTATVRTRYVRDGVRHTREVFASAPGQVIAVRLTVDRPGALRFTAAFDSPQRSTSTAPDDRSLALDGVSGTAQGIEGRVRFRALLRAVADDGKVTSSDEGIVVTDATTVTLLLSVGTSYRSYRDVDGDPVAEAAKHLTHAASLPYQALRGAHVADHQRLFRRVDLDLGPSDVPELPTDQRIARFANGNDPALVALHYQFGRYLLIASSRPGGGQPANLQGLWNDSMSPPWDSKFTTNINLEMNYWAAAPANLVECYEPLFDLISDLSVTGARTARSQYDARGWVCHHNTDGWRGTAPVDFSLSGMWPGGGAWLCKSYWDHYEFTGDTEALRRHYPVMKGAAQFFLDTLVPEPSHNWLVTNPSVSPEVAHHAEGGGYVCAGPTLDTELLRDLFTSCAEAAKVLHVDPDFRAAVLAARARLAPLQVGHLGQLQEWLKDWDDTADLHNRHVSHLYALFPGDQITPEGTPELLEAARTSLVLRGDDGTGWSLAWKINLWARMLDGEHAYQLLAGLLVPEHTAPNLFDLHPPFQIDGNFGAVSGVTEMLLQSRPGSVRLLPALPSAWLAGRFDGLRARGGVTVGADWACGQAREFRLATERDGPIALRSPMFTGRYLVVDTATGRAAETGRPDGDTLTVRARAGHSYRAYSLVELGLDTPETLSVGRQAKVTLTVRAVERTLPGATATLTTPEGWRVEPARALVEPTRAGEEQTVSFTVVPAAGDGSPTCRLTARLAGDTWHAEAEAVSSLVLDTVPVDISASFDNDGISTAADPGAGDFDGAGYSYPAEQLPTPGAFASAGVSFTFPGAEDGRDDNLQARGQTLELPGGQYAAAWILASAANSPTGASEATITVTYADGSTSRETVEVTDWAKPPGANETAAVRTTYRHGPGGEDGLAVSIHQQRFPLDPARTAVSVTLPDTPQIHLFALTVEK